MASPNLPPVNSKEFKLYKSFVEYHLKRAGGTEIRLFEKNKYYKNSYFVDNFKDFDKIINENINKDIIITLNQPSKKGIKLKDDDFKRFLYIFLDLDFKNLSDNEKSFFSKEVLEQVLYELGLEYSYKSKGRGGYHYLIPVSLDVSDDNQAKIKKFLELLETKSIEKIKDYYKKDDFEKYKGVIDRAVSNPSRLMRCPNTFNYKRNEPTLNLILEFYSLGDNQIQKNSDFIQGLVIEQESDNLTNNSIKNNTNKGFFEYLLTTESLWQELYQDWQKADERYTVFIKNLGAFVKKSKDYLDLAYKFLINMNYLKNRKSQITHLFEKDIKINDINLIELYKWAIKYNLDNFRKLIKRFLSNENVVYTSGDNLRVIYDSELGYYKLQYLKQVKDDYTWKVWGAFRDLKKVRRHIYSINSNVSYEVKELLIIDTINSNDDNSIHEFDIDKREFVSIGKLLKIGNLRDDSLFDSYQEFFKWILSLDYEEEYYTNCYGVFDSKNILLPNKFNLLSESNTLEVNNFIEFHQTDILPINKLKNIGGHLREYLAYSKYSQIIFAYSLIIPFRYYLMNRGLKEFGFLGVRGKSGIGKSTRIKILCNLFHSNYNSEGYSEDILQSLFRFSSLQTILTPLVLDDPNKIDNNIISVLKELGTSKIIDTFKGTSSLKLKYYRFFRPIILSFNNLTIKDSALINRFIFIDIDNVETGYIEISPKEDLIISLENSINLIGRFFWGNIHQFIEVLEKINFNTSRVGSKITILKLGFIIMNELFRMLGIDEISSFDISDFLSNSDDFIYDEKDEFRLLLIENIKNLTKTTVRFDDTASEYNIFNLSYEDYDSSKYKPIFRKCEKYGLYLDSSNNVVITTKTLNYLNIKGYKIKKLKDITNYLNNQISEYKTVRVVGEDNPVRGVILINNFDSNDNEMENDIKFEEINL